MEKIATDIYSFKDLREGGFTYVDKTDVLLRLVNGSIGKQFFVARPRRFGKSLTISTLQCLFEGKHELFKGLAIEPNWDWSSKWPVIHLDMGSCQADTVTEFRGKLEDRLMNIVKDLDLTLEKSNSVDSLFFNVCRAAASNSTDGKMVLLVDEYDKPLLGHLGKPDVNEFRDALKSFYSVIKTCEGLQRFALITGVSKFSKVSIFSDLNNLIDVTLDARISTLMGYTHEEVERFFPESLVALGEANHLTRDEAFARILEMYNGYRFHYAASKVVNPVSLGRCLSMLEFRSFWYETGTPTFLVDELKQRPLNIDNLVVEESQLGTYEPSNPAIVSLLFQTGYLTIKSMEQLGGRRNYTLGFPNAEVRDAFHTSLVNVYTAVDELELGNAQWTCAKALIAHNLENFMESLKIFFANIPYNLTDRGGEQIFHAILYTILRFIGVCVHAEVKTNRGRVDAVIEAGNEIYIVEVKLNHTAQEAITQIKEMGYADKYRASGRRITLLGIGFSSKTRDITDWSATFIDS